jgi:RNA polymerase sigma-70 factor, ECF subfamily
LVREESVGFRVSERHWAYLIGLAAAGNQGALAELYDETSHLVHGLVCRIVENREDAREVTHDTYLQVWRNAGSYDATRGKASTWLTTIARSRAIDRLRSSGSRRRMLEDPMEACRDLRTEEDGPEEHRLDGERRRRINAALHRLSFAQRQAIGIAYYEGLSHSEIADRLNLPIGTVKTRIRLGMVKLRSELAGEIG